jgi:hypothetical protein
MGLLSFRSLFPQLAPLERRHRQQGASTLGVCELGKPIAFRRFAQAIFTGFHLPHCPIQGDAFRRPLRPNQQLYLRLLVDAPAINGLGPLAGRRERRLRFVPWVSRFCMISDSTTISDSTPYAASNLDT